MGCSECELTLTGFRESAKPTVREEAGDMETALSFHCMWLIPVPSVSAHTPHTVLPCAPTPLCHSSDWFPHHSGFIPQVYSNLLMMPTGKKVHQEALWEGRKIEKWLKHLSKCEDGVQIPVVHLHVTWA